MADDPKLPEPLAPLLAAISTKLDLVVKRDEEIIALLADMKKTQDARYAEAMKMKAEIKANPFKMFGK